MKELLHDKLYLIFQGLSIVTALIYLLSTNGYHHTLIFISWIAALVLFSAAAVRCAMKKKWIMTSFNLAFVVLFFMSLMLLPYNT